MSLQELSNEIMHYAHSHNVTLVCETPEVTDANIDHHKVQRVVANLLRNGIECGAQNVRIFAFKMDTNLVVCVADDGPGVPPEFVSKLFERGKTWGKQDGSGFGLSYANEVARGHGGEITHSRVEDWTYFKITFPDAVFSDAKNFDGAKLPILGIALANLEIAKDQSPKLFLFIEDPEIEQKLKENLNEMGVEIHNNVTIWQDNLTCIVYGDSDIIPDQLLESKNRIIFANPTDQPDEIAIKLQRIVKMHATRI